MIARPTVLLGLLLAVAAPRAGASDRVVSPSGSTIKPLALEFQLIAHLAREHPGKKKALAERAAYLKNYGAGGYGVKTASPSADAAARHLAARKAAYLALTALPLREASALVTSYVKRERVRIKANQRAGKNRGRAAPIYALAAGIDGTVRNLRDQIRNLRNVQRLGRIGRDGRRIDPRAHIDIQEQIRRIERQIKDLEGLKKNVTALTAKLKPYDKLLADIESTATKNARAERAAGLAEKASALASPPSGVTAAAGLGTHQVRFTLTEEKRAAIEQELSGRILGQEKKRIGFITGTLDFLPLLWNPAKPPPIEGDVRLSEYICGDELFLTIYDCAGVWYRIVVLQYKNKLYVLAPSKPL
jgi:hypothetical protein